VPILSKLVLFGFIIVLGFGGFTAIGGFLLMMGIDLIIGIGGYLASIIGSIITTIGTLIGLGIAYRYQKHEKQACIDDPNCELTA